MTHWPKVSFITATYARPPQYLHLLSEAVESFRRNAVDYPGEAEMVIVNDAPGQTLTCNVPGVRICNLPTRFASLGEKLNYAIDNAAGSVILPQDDDDISLAHRARFSVERLGDFDYFVPLAYYFWSGNLCQWEQRTGYSHNCSAFRKAVWQKVGGYPHISGPQDAHMDGLLRRNCRVIQGPITRAETFFVYCWGRSDIHLSGHPDTETAYREHGKKPVTAGAWRIEPCWTADYAKMAEMATER